MKFPNCQLCGNPVSFELWDGERVCECRGTRLSPRQLAEYLVEREDFVSSLTDSAGISEASV